MNKSIEKLITTTQALLWERGYVGTSPRAIQDRAGVGQGSMYHHFRTKAELAQAAEERSAAELIEEVRALLDAPGDPLDRVLTYLRRERDVLKGCRIGRLAADPEVVADPALRKPLEHAFGWITERLAALLREAQDCGRLPQEWDAQSLAATVLAVIQGGYVLARAANSPAPFEQAIEGLIALLTNNATAED
ncbi:TetR/AcrR family transcriptional regulator [Saccharophagus sp. K07]|jgi:TetR/AcrR family transcriptional repressor of nem operon|uniref:TetR/AcrR family transcriptional regulator n=1 Tax=Saccharophagus sp. K07 TaxID=2283636 RepID=UPI001652B474|nr:TetR/AcrR family transcriptional regulator [Saccharophagus sp. K07]MBC6903904.1 TetR/AcrR family transcriptional regulator [Saccharophagus sp. K07]